MEASKTTANLDSPTQQKSSKMKVNISFQHKYRRVKPDTG